MPKLVGDFMQPKHIFKVKNRKAETEKVSAEVDEILKNAPIPEPEPERISEPEPEKPKRGYTRKPKQEADHAGPSPEG